MAPADSARADEQGHGRLVSVDALPSQRAFANTGKAIGFSYLTRNQRGALAPATGAIYLPKGETPPGGWPVIVWAHGTVGVSSGCAPSKSGQGERNGKYFSRVLAEGFAVIAPDYQGLGSGGQFSYYNRDVEGASILDAVSAAHTAEKDLGGDWSLIGQSEGAHAAMSAASMEPSYPTPFGQRLRSIVVTGLRADPSASVSAIFLPTSPRPRSPHQIGYAGYFLATLADLNPASVLPYLTPFGADFVKKARTLCLGDLVAYAEKHHKTAADLVLDPEHPTPAFADDVERLASYDDAAIPADVMIGYGSDDIDGDPTTTPGYARQLQAANPSIAVELKEYPGQDHSGAFLASRDDALDFVHDHMR